MDTSRGISRIPTSWRAVTLSLEAVRVDPRPLLRARMKLGEGPTWDERTASLWWVDIEGYRVWRKRGSHTRCWHFDEPVSAIVHRQRAGHVVVSRRALLLTDDELRVEAAIPMPLPQDPRLRLNDAGVDPAGRLWVGSMATDGSRDLGALYRVNPGAQPEVVLSGTSISNGLGWNRTGTTFYFTDTPTGRVDAYEYDASTGSLGSRQTFLDLEDEIGQPDGLTVDADDHVWVALWGGGSVLRVAPDGRVVGRIRLPGRNVTSCVFGGQSLDRLFITTAYKGLREHELLAEPLAGCIFIAQPTALGRPVARYAG